MNSNTKRIATMAALAITCLAFVEPSLAQNAIELSNSLKGSSALITMVCYLGALVFGLMGALKWKAYGRQPERTLLKMPVICWGIAVLLACLGGFLVTTGDSSLWGAAAGGSGPSVIGQH